MSFSYSGGVITQANETAKSIVSMADGGSDNLIFSISSHGYSLGDVVQVEGTSSYNGTYIVESIIGVNAITTPNTTINEVLNEFGSSETGSIARGDKDLSGISGLTGVTVNDTQYTLDDVQLVINGSLSISRVSNRLRFINYSDRLGVESIFIVNGFFNNYVKRIVNGYEYIDPTPSMEFIFNRSNGSNVGLFDFYIKTTTSSTSIFEGTIIFNDTASTGAGHQLNLELNGNATLKNVNAINTQVIGQNNLIYSTAASSTLTIENCSFYGTGIRTGDNTLNISGFKTYGAPALTINTFQDVNDLQVSNFAFFGGGGIRYAGISTKFARFLNIDTNAPAPLSLANYVQDVPASNNGVQALLTNSATFIVQDSSGAVVGAKIYAIDVDNGNRPSTNYGPGETWEIETSSDLTYSGSTDSNGELNLTVISGIFYCESDSEQVDNRGILNTYDLNFKVCSYIHSLSNQSPSLFGDGNKTVNFLLLIDTLITESTKSIVDAYTTINDASMLYDRSKSYLYDNFSGENTTTISRSALQAGLGSVDLIIDSNAASPYSLASSTITINSSTFIGGATATTGTVTVQSAASLSGGVFDCDVNYSSSATTLTNVTCNNTLDFDTVGTYTIDGGTISETTNSSGGTITVNLINGATVTTNTGPDITLQQLVDITASNIIDGSRVQIYNVTKATELDNSIVSGGLGYSISVNLLSASVDEGDTIRLRATYTSGTTAKYEAVSTGIIGTNDLSFLTTQDNDDVYNILALDGSTITKFTADYVNDEVDLVIGSNWTMAELYSWWTYNTTTSQGISDFFGGITALDEVNFRINTSVVDLYLDNTTNASYRQTDNRRFFRDTGDGYPVRDPTTSSYGLDVVWRSPVAIAASESIQSNLTDILDDTDELQQNQNNWLTATGFSTFNPTTDQVNVATNNDKTGYSIFGTKNTLDDLNDVSASDVYAEFTTGSNEDVFKADVSNLDVAVSTRNSIAPDNAGIAASDDMDDDLKGERAVN